MSNQNVCPNSGYDIEISQQFREIYDGNRNNIFINKNIAKELTEAEICIIVHAISKKNCTLDIQNNVLKYFDHTYSKILVEDIEIENLNILIMLYIIRGNALLGPNIIQAMHGKKQITHTASDFIQLSQYFGVNNHLIIDNIIRILKIDNHQYDDTAENNIKKYIGLDNGTKSARNV